METILITNEADSFRVTQKAFDVIYKNNGFKVVNEQSGDDENVRETETETETATETATKQVKKVRTK